jgi:uncharacterized protein (TIGR02001 family)
MSKRRLLIAVLGAFIALPAVAEGDSPFSANIGLVSDYLYRGISQTGHNPAIQGGFDYEHSGGFYAGVWASNVSFYSDLYTETAGAAGASNSSLELDTYLGFKSALTQDVNYDVGFLRYNYPGTYPAGATKADTDEIYGAIGYKWITAKYSYSLGDTFATASARGTDYLEINVDYPIAESLSLGAHAGRQTFKGPNAGTGAMSLSYTDYKVGVTKEIGGYELGLAYSKTNAATGVGSAYYILGKDLGKGTAVLSVTRSF